MTQEPSTVDPPTNPTFSVHLMVGLLIALVAAVAFALIAFNVRGDSPVTRLDREISSSLEEAGKSSPMLVEFFMAVTHMGDFKFLAAVGGLVAIGLFLIMIRRHLYWPLALGWVMATLGGSELNYRLKLLFERPRPKFVAPLVHERSFSFPSGHSMGSMLIYGMLAYLLIVTLPNRLSRLIVIVGWLALVLAIGFSRVYLGAHWPSDVIGGYAAGSVWLLVCIAVTEHLRKRVARRHAPRTELPA